MQYSDLPSGYANNLKFFKNNLILHSATIKAIAKILICYKSNT
jgi:hypothetical protein